MVAQQPAPLFPVASAEVQDNLVLWILASKITMSLPSIIENYRYTRCQDE